MVTMTRQEYNAAWRAMLVAVYDDDARRVWERTYPRGTPDAEFECHMRGTLATQGRVEPFSRLPDVQLRIVGKQRLWYPSDIDRLVAHLAAGNALTPLAEEVSLRNVSFGEAVADDGVTRLAWLRGLVGLKKVPGETLLPVRWALAELLGRFLETDLTAWGGTPKQTRQVFKRERDHHLRKVAEDALAPADLVTRAMEQLTGSKP